MSAQEADVIDLFTRRPAARPAQPGGAARSVVLVLPAEDGVRIVVVGAVGAATAAALISHLKAALAGGGHVTVDLSRARIDDPVAVAGALKENPHLHLIGHSEGAPPTAA
jgi:hypothetical protein